MTVHAAQSALRRPKSAQSLFPQLKLTTPTYALKIQHGNTRTAIPPQILTGHTPLGAPSPITPVALKLSFKNAARVQNKL